SRDARGGLPRVYCRYLCIALRRNSTCFSNLEQAAQTERWRRRTSCCHPDSGASSRWDTRRDASLQRMMWPSARLNMGTGARGSGGGAVAGKPVLLEALAKRHPGPVEDDPQVIRVDRQFLTDLVGLELHHLAHHEDAGRVG